MRRHSSIDWGELAAGYFWLGGTSPPKPKKKSLGGRDVFVKALSHGTDPSILRTRHSSLLSQLWRPQPSQPISPCKNPNHPNFNPQKHGGLIPEKPIRKHSSPSPSQFMPYFNISHLLNPCNHLGISALRKTSFQEAGRRWYERKQRVSGRADAAPENSAKVKGERRRWCWWLLLEIFGDGLGNFGVRKHIITSELEITRCPMVFWDCLLFLFSCLED